MHKELSTCWDLQAVIWLLNFRLINLLIRLLETSRRMRLWAPMGVSNLGCWLRREQEVGSTWGTLIPCASLSHCVQGHLFTSKFYYTLIVPFAICVCCQHRPHRQLNNNAFARETVEWILFKLSFCPQIIQLRVWSLFSKYSIRNMMHEWSVSCLEIKYRSKWRIMAFKDVGVVLYNIVSTTTPSLGFLGFFVTLMNLLWFFFVICSSHLVSVAVTPRILPCPFSSLVSDLPWKTSLQSGDDNFQYYNQFCFFSLLLGQKIV